MAVCAYGLFSVIYCSRPFGTFVGLFVGSVVGLALAAPVWLTFLETLQYTFQPHQTWTFSAGELAVNGQGFGNFVFPALFGGINEFSFLSVSGSEYTSPGWLPPCIGFFVLAGLLRTRSRHAWFFLGLFLFVALKIYSFPPLQLLAKLPVLDEIIWPRYAAFLMMFSAAVLAAIGLAKIQQGGSELRRTFKIYACLIGLFALELLDQILTSGVPTYGYALAALGLGLAWALLPPLVLIELHKRWGIGSRFLIAAGLGVLLPAVAYNTGGFSWKLQLIISAVYLVVFGISGAVLARKQQFKPGADYPGAIIAIVLPMMIFAAVTGYGPPWRYDVLTRPPYINKLAELQQDGLYRHLPFDAAPMPNVQTGLGLPGLSWIVPAVPNDFRRFYRRFLDRGLAIPNWYAANVTITPPIVASVEELHRNIRFFSLAGVKYVTAQQIAVMSGEARLSKAFSDTATGTSIFENPNANARLFLASDIENVEDQAQAWDLLSRLQGDLSKTVAVEGSVTSSSDCSDRKLDIQDFAVDANSVHAVVAAPCAGMLVLSDLYFPGWHAGLDGTEQKLYRVDGIFRGVRIEHPGRYVLEFWYRPLTWTISLSLVSVGLVALIVLTVFSGPVWGRVRRFSN